MPGRSVVLIDDDPQIPALLSGILAPHHVSFTSAPDARSGLAAVRKLKPQLVLLDLDVPGASGLETLAAIHAQDASIDVVLLTGDHSLRAIVAGAKRGALDYVTKPLDAPRLAQRVERWLTRPRSCQGSAEPHYRLTQAAAQAGLIGNSPAFFEILGQVDRIATHFRTALISGPTGSGKELMARLLYSLSGCPGPLVVFNCAAVPAALFESELFGHTRGAFTGAAQDRAGMVEHAQGGLLLFDEIGELSLAAQATLLRLVQNREFKRLGSAGTRSADIRIVAATNRDLASMVEAKTFREDLYHRIAAVEIRVPPLCERREDLPGLVHRILADLAKRYSRGVCELTPQAHALIEAYHWPGNIRELENVLDYCVMVSPGDTIDAADFPEHVHTGGGWLSLAQMESLHLAKVLQHVGGNKKEAAGVLGISRASLYRMLG